MKKSADEVIAEADEFLRTYHDRSKALELLREYSAVYGDDYRIWLEMARSIYPLDEALEQIYEYHTIAIEFAPAEKKEQIKSERDRLLEEFDEGKNRRKRDLTVQIAFCKSKIKEFGDTLENLEKDISEAKENINENRRKSTVFSEEAEEFRLRAARLSIKPPSMFLIFAVPVVIAAIIFGILIICGKETENPMLTYIVETVAFLAAGAVIVSGTVRTILTIKSRRCERNRILLLRQSEENITRLEIITSRLNRRFDSIAETRSECESDMKKMQTELSAIKTSHEILNK